MRFGLRDLTTVTHNTRMVELTDRTLSILDGVVTEDAAAGAAEGPAAARMQEQRMKIDVTSNRRLAKDFDWPGTGIVIVDQGSRRQESNRRHEAFVEGWRASGRYPMVESAHMELADPSIPTAFDACVAAATHVVIAPFFLWPGTHWDRDIPALAAQAAARHPGVGYLVTAPPRPAPASNRHRRRAHPTLPRARVG